MGRSERPQYTTFSFRVASTCVTRVWRLPNTPFVGPGVLGGSSGILAKCCGCFLVCAFG